MTHVPSPDRARLLGLAQAQPIEDPELANAWTAIVTAIRSGWLVPGDGPHSIRGSLAQLDATGLLSVEEYTLEDDDEHSARALVTLIGDTWSVPRNALVAALRRLDDEFRAGHGPGRGPDPEPPPLPDSAALRRAFQSLLGASQTAPDSPAAARVRRDAREALERLGKANDAELRAALEGLEPSDRTRMAEALRTFAAWAEQPEGRGEVVDDAIRALENTIGRLLPGRRAQERATDARIRSSAQDAIAARLRGL
jgi:hypothetical protein